MRKMLLLVVMVVAIALAITPAVAGDHSQNPTVTYILGAGSSVAVQSGSASIGHHASGSMTGAINQSSAYVAQSGTSVYTGATSHGATITGGFGYNLATAGQEGYAFGSISVIK